MSVLKYKDPETGEIIKVGAPAVEGYTKEEVDRLIEGIPVPDVSGQIGVHNEDTAAHSDIRATLRNKAELGEDGKVLPEQLPNMEVDAFSKEETLSSSTKTALGLGENATPDDAFNALNNKDVFKVGDTFTTLRTDLDDNWLLANGASIKKVDYPDLEPLLSHNTSGFTKIYDEPRTGSDYNMRGVAYGDGMWVAIGGHSCIYVATDPIGEWQTITISTNFMPRGITYDDSRGLWIISGFKSNVVHIATSSDPTGEWVLTSLGWGGVVDDAMPIATTEHYIALLYRNGSGVLVGYKLNDGDWQQTYVYSSTSAYPRGLIYHKTGSWCALLNWDSGNSYFFVASSPGSSWTNYFPYNYGGQQPFELTYKNDTLMYCGSFAESSSTSPFVCFSTSSPREQNSWTWLKVATSNNNLNYGGARRVTYASGKWYVVTEYGYIFESADNGATWSLYANSKDTLKLCGSSSFYTIGGLNVDEHGWDIFGTINYDPYVVSDKLMHLNTVQIDGAYTYIKAKE